MLAQSLQNVKLLFDAEVATRQQTKFDSPVAKEMFNHERIIKLLEDHKSGKKDCYKKVWTIYTFLVWYDQFFA